MNHLFLNDNGKPGNLLTLAELHDLQQRAANGERIFVFCEPIHDWAQVRSDGLVFQSKDGEYGFVWPKIDDGYGVELLAFAPVGTEDGNETL